MEDELQDALQQLDEMTKNKTEIESARSGLMREKNQILSQLEESEEQLSEVLLLKNQSRDFLIIQGYF